MIWILGLTGILLTLLGLWGGPARARKRREMDALSRKQPTAEEAWDILARPLEEEVIKIPEHRPWYTPGSDRRFQRGLAVGLGAGLMVASVAVSLVPRAAAPVPPTTAKKEQAPAPAPAETAKTAPTQPAPAAQAPAQPQPKPVTQPPKPANVTFVVEPGDLATTIAANLKAQGLIADERAFLTRVTDLQKDTLLRSGTFVVPTGADLDQVIGALTGA